MFETQTVLFATDFSERSEPMFHRACALARQQGARLVALHVAAPPVHGLALAQRDEYHRLWNDLHRLQSRAPEVELEHLLRQGDTAQEIVRVARQVNCAVIVLAMRDRTGLGRILRGSMVAQVVRRAPCPVLTELTTFARVTLAPL